MLSTVFLAAEDEPGLAVGQKLVKEHARLTIYREFNARGYGGLKSRVPNYHVMGVNGFPVLMITDLDSSVCASEMIHDWLGRPPSAGFLFRICVREVESWLLAHREAMAEFLKVRLALIPTSPESLPDPKKRLMDLAKTSSQRKIRLAFTPIGSSTIGPDQNAMLKEYIFKTWDPAEAAKSAPSLARARERLRVLAISVYH